MWHFSWPSEAGDKCYNIYTTLKINFGPMLKEGAEKRADDAEMVLKRFRLQVKFAHKNTPVELLISHQPARVTVSNSVIELTLPTIYCIKVLKRRILTTFKQHIAKFGFLLNLLVLMIFWMYWIIYKMLINNVKTRSVPSTAWMQSRGWRHQYLHSLIIFHRSFKYKSRSFRRFQAEKKKCMIIFKVCYLCLRLLSLHHCTCT